MNREIIYYPGKYSRGGLDVWKEMFFELRNTRELIWRLFVKDFKARYKQSILGVFWAFLMPFVMIGSFIYLNKAGIVDIGIIDIPYPLFALLGITFWQLFATGLVGCTNSIVTAGSVIIKINIPKKTLVIASLGQTIFEFAIRFVLIGLCFFYYRIAPSWEIIFIPLLIIPLLLITLSLGFFLALLNAVIRDVINIINVLLPFVMLITPVMYVSKPGNFSSIINKYNPIGISITILRDLVIGRDVSIFPVYLVVSLSAIFLFLVAWRVMHIIEPRLAERV